MRGKLVFATALAGIARAQALVQIGYTKIR